MGEQDRFLELIQDIKDIAVSQHNIMSKEEIEKYLSGMELDSDKLEAVYHYLGAAGVEIKGYKFIPDISDMKAISGKGINEDEKSGAKSETKMGSNLCSIIKDFMSGDENARNKLIESHLDLVIKLASGYRKRDVVVNKNVTLDEVIAEGNVGLLEGISVIEQNMETYFTKEGEPDYDAVIRTIELEIVNAMENMLDGETSNKDWEGALLAKINLLHEAAKFITEEIGRVPTRAELSDYTKVSVEEIDNIRGLSKDAERVADDT